MLLLVQLALIAMLGIDLWNRTSNGAEVQSFSVVALLGLGLLAVMTALRWRRERLDQQEGP